jgi:disulfide oxidoreductase YuzD
MPVEWRLHVLEEKLKRVVGERFVIEPVDLYGLTPVDQHVAISAIMAQNGDFPVVLVDGEVACVGDIDTEAIVAAVSQRLKGNNE